jgi:hypothetical protein
MGCKRGIFAGLTALFIPKTLTKGEKVLSLSSEFEKTNY